MSLYSKKPWIRERGRWMMRKLCGMMVAVVEACPPRLPLPSLLRTCVGKA